MHIYIYIIRDEKFFDKWIQQQRQREELRVLLALRYVREPGYHRSLREVLWWVLLAVRSHFTEKWQTRGLQRFTGPPTIKQRLFHKSGFFLSKFFLLCHGTYIRWKVRNRCAGKDDFCLICLRHLRMSEFVLYENNYIFHACATCSELPSNISTMCCSVECKITQLQTW